jgi:hypothetical protein
MNRTLKLVLLGLLSLLWTGFKWALLLGWCVVAIGFGAGLIWSLLRFGFRASTF